MEEDAREEGAEQLSSRNQSYPRDLLRRFAGSTSLHEHPAAEAGGKLDEVELSLGLSLGGCLGSDPRAEKKKLVRSSSISSLSIFSRESDFPPAGTALARTCSLPVETEADYRKRKELQSLKRLEAKRKRSEKRNSKSDEAKAEKLEAELGARQWFPGSTKLDRVGPSGLPAWAARPTRRMSQGSIGSRGSSSSGLSDLENRPTRGIDISMSGGSGGDEDPLKKSGGRGGGMGEMEKSMMEEMPCVSTRGEGPNGRRIEGFLYKYRKGEEVRIVCVCHGSFLTPAEFVRHAGGGDVDHPLRHIVVSPTPAFL